MDSRLRAVLKGWSHTIKVEPIGLPSWDPEAPDLIEPLTAFRSWRVVGGRLRSPYQPVFWDEPVLDARCEGRMTDVHPAPDPACGCGIYACLAPDPDFPKVDYRAVAGIVTLWGRVEMHDDGMRAEHARVEALAPYSCSSRRLKLAVCSIADHLGIDLVDLDEIEAAAAGYGSRLYAAGRV
jgi:hypothetical protein